MNKVFIVTCVAILIACGIYGFMTVNIVKSIPLSDLMERKQQIEQLTEEGDVLFDRFQKEVDNLENGINDLISVE